MKEHRARVDAVKKKEEEIRCGANHSSQGGSGRSRHKPARNENT